MSEGFIIYVEDTETTGLAEDCDIIEISLMRFSFTDVSFPAEQKTWYLKALHPERISNEALEKNGHKRADILWQTEEGRLKYQEPKLVVEDIERWMMQDGVSSIDRIYAGQNYSFDLTRMLRLWDSLGYKDSFPWAVEKGERCFDTKQLAIIVDICTGKRRQYFNLGSLVKAFGVKKEKAHRGDADVRMTAGFISKVLDPIKDLIAEVFKDCYNEE